LGLVWFRKNEEMTVLAAGFGIGRATAYRYRDKIVTVLSEQAPDLPEAMQQVTEQGWSQVILDGKVFRTDRCAEATTSTKGTTIHSWYSGQASGEGLQPLDICSRPAVSRVKAPVSRPRVAIAATAGTRNRPRRSRDPCDRRGRRRPQRRSHPQ
jgi:hypothetical protein